MKVLEFTPQKEPGNFQRVREKELIRAYSVIDLNKGTELIDCRLYMGRSKNSSIVYCLIWVHCPEHWITCKGEAGGYGYHKQSAAVAYAIRGAGIELDECIDGVGNDAVRDALLTVAGYFFPGKRLYICESYA